jgi:hypothetical protein
VKRDVAAAPGLDHLDAVAREFLRRGDDVGPIVACLDPERDDGRMLEEQQLIGDRTGPARVDELLLERERLGVADEPQPSDLERPQSQPSSNPSSRSLTNVRKRPASAPSTRR